MVQPLVTVFLPTHARAVSGLLQQAVESVLAQTYRNFELFLIDDASSDGSADYLKQIAKADKRAVYIRHDRNVGLPALTLAQAYMKSKGEFLAFIFDDNQWLPEHLETLLGAYDEKPELDMVYGIVRMECRGAEPLIFGSEPFDLSKLAEANYIGNGGVVLRRKAVEHIGWYDPHIIVKRSCDWDLWMRIGKRLKIGHCSKLVALENGGVQPDSLGSSVNYFDKLTRKYQMTDRDHLLAPNLVAVGGAAPFAELSWMDAEEKRQLAILSLEHFLRTEQVAEAVDLSRRWLKGEQPDQDKIAAKQDSEVLVEAFNDYLAETRFACKLGCHSAYELDRINHAYGQINVAYVGLEQNYSRLEGLNADLRKHAEELDAKHERRYRNLKGHFQELERLHQELVGRNKLLKGERARLAHDFAELQNQFRDSQVNSSQHLNAERAYAHLNDQYHAVLRSLSWRVTKPLRVISRLFRNKTTQGQLTRF
jgi:hypothetical protein